MSTHNIGFYEDLTKIIFELSSNIIKYAPYFFCCLFFCSSATYSSFFARAYSGGAIYFVFVVFFSVLSNIFCLHWCAICYPVHDVDIMQ